MLVKKIRFLVSLSMLSLVLALSPQVSATSFTSLVAFGDSLSDSGNIFDLFGGAFGPNPPYTEARFTSPYTNGDPGLVWLEHLALLMSVPLDNSVAGGTNYAFGGAKALDAPGQLVPAISDQVGFYFNDLAVAGATLDASGLFVVFAGGNDVRDNDDGMASAGGIITALNDLYMAGARNFLIPNLPDIGLTPESQAGLAPGSADPAVISAATAEHNAALAAGVAALQASLTDASFITFDLFGLFNEILTTPGDFGLSNVTDACAGIMVGSVTCSDPDSFLFFDGIHPTAITHEMMGQLAYSALKPIPVPAALPLMLTALGLLGWRSRRA